MTAPFNIEPSVATVLERLAAAQLPPFESCTPAQARELSRKIRSVREPRPVRSVEDIRLDRGGGDLLLRRYVEADLPRAAILFLHGGGWTLGSVEESDALTRALALTTECQIYSLEYSLAPEAPFPAALQDVEAALRWLMQATDLPLIIMGDSAGANIATVAARHARDWPESRIALQILAYPVTDARMDTASFSTFADGPLLTRATMAWFWDQYLPAVEQRSQPDASPLRADLHGMPAAFILTAENDVLRDEGAAYAAALQAAGVSTVHTTYGGQIHGFLGMVGVSDGNARALSDIAALIKERF